MDAELHNLLFVWSSAIAALLYCRFIPPKVPPAFPRFISLLPIFLTFSFLPLYTSSAFLAAHHAFFFSWLANFRLLLFSFDRGPLTSPYLSQSLPLFFLFAALPFTIKPQNDAVPSKTLPLYLHTKIPIAAILISVVYKYRDNLHLYTLLLAYCCLIFLAIEIIFGFSILLVRGVLGVEVEPASDEPYLSTSLQEFWGRRWNLTVTNLLRPTVYEPVRAGAGRVVGREKARAVGVLATFVVSGVMHELMFWYVRPTVRPTWEMTMYFVVQGVGVVVEKMVVGRGKKGWVGWMWTMGYVVGTRFCLFFPPLLRNGSDVRTVNELRSAVEFLIGTIFGLFGIWNWGETETLI